VNERDGRVDRGARKKCEIVGAGRGMAAAVAGRHTVSVGELPRWRVGLSLIQLAPATKG